MSIERICRTCGEPEDIRYNFGNDLEAEREFHSKDYFCSSCVAMGLDELANELDERYESE